MASTNPTPVQGSATTTTASAKQTNTNALPYMPNELLNEVAMYLEEFHDLASMRLVSRQYAEATVSAFCVKLVQGTILYPTSQSMGKFLVQLERIPSLPLYVNKITLIAETFKMHEYGYSWAWENLEDWERARFTTGDMVLIDDINKAHTTALQCNNRFIHAGEYRKLLCQILTTCVNLRTIVVRKLQLGEHIPGWIDLDMFRNISFYHEHLDTNGMLYGDWLYDTHHGRVTSYTDEYGERITEEGAGPQASFCTDVAAAHKGSGSKACVEIVRV